MAFGISPKHTQEITIETKTSEELLVVALLAAKQLKWNISRVTKNGFLAYTRFSMTSWSEEVKCVINEDGVISIKSECTGSQIIDWGKNKKNTEAFEQELGVHLKNLTEDQLVSEYQLIKDKYQNLEGEVLVNTALSKKESLSGWMSIFKPTDGYMVTPILVYINVLVFILMCLAGSNIFLPDNQVLLDWGANFRPVTMQGQWWRLFTSCFVHIGLMHLLLNIYALIYIGLLLEPYLGKTRFLTAYLITGIVGSLGSIMFNDNVISAGASGAIFGMYGVFLAMLTTNLIEKSARKALLTSIAVFVGYNLVNGLKGGIDNAAHIGGLASGIVIGYCYLPSLKNTSAKLKRVTVGVLLVVFIVASSFAITSIKPNDLDTYVVEIEEFVKLEEKALSVFELLESSSDEVFTKALQETGVTNWKKAKVLIEKLDVLDVPEEVHARNALLKKYCQLRINSYDLFYRSIVEDTQIYDGQIKSYNSQINSIINQLSVL